MTPHGGIRDGRTGSFTFGYLGNRYSGLIHLGRQDGRPTLSGALLFRPGGRDRHHHGHFDQHHFGHHRHHFPHYGVGHYYHNYTPVSYYPYYRSYAYWPAYSYVSAYYPQPVVYQSYYYDESYPVSSYGVDQAYTTTEVYDESTVVQPGTGAQAAPYETGEPSSEVVGPPPPADVETEYEAIEEPKDTPWVQRGADAFAAGNYDDARRLFSQVMLADERDGYAKLLYGLSNFAMGEFQVAAIAVRRALLTTDFLIERPLDMRTLYPEQIAFGTQLDQLIRHVADHKNDREAKFLLAYLYYAIGRTDPAVALLTELTATDSADTLAAKLHDAARTAEPVERSPE